MTNFDKVFDFIPPLEKYMGIYCYLILTQPAFGRIKLAHEDFVVEELIKEPPRSKRGDYLVVKIEKRNWDTIKLARVIASRIGVPKKDVQYLGIKDKLAVTTQYFFIKNGNIEHLNKIKEIPDTKIKDYFFTNYFSMDILLGNSFKIVVYDIKNMDNFKKACEELTKKGFLNYFGVQRFGITRPISHVIGRLLLSEDYEGAFYYLLCFQGQEELEKTKYYRSLIENGELEKFVKEAPPWLYYEKLLVANYLRFKDYKKAFKRLPQNYKKIFFHAYQSYLFNRALSYYYLYDKVPDTITVSKNDPFIEEILWDDGITNFRSSRKLGVKLKPIKRKSIEFPKEFKYKIISSNRVILEFNLNKGVYATSLIREICKNKYW